MTSLGRDRSRYIRLACLWGKRLARASNGRSRQHPHFADNCTPELSFRFRGVLRNEPSIIDNALVSDASIDICDHKVKLPVVRPPEVEVPNFERLLETRF